LLSRYRQQRQSIPEALTHGPVLSDYTFAKDSLFAHLNLTGDELTVYERLHGALAEKIPIPDLVVYLRANLDVLMARIAARDRPYERAMDRAYIDSLRLAYDGFFAAYSRSPVLVIDTNRLDFVQDAKALSSIRERIMSTLGEGAHQEVIPQFAPVLDAAGRAALAEGSRRLGDLQRWQRVADGANGRPADVLQDFLEFTQAVGVLGAVLAERDATRPAMNPVLASCLRRLMRLANAADIDLEEAYVTQELGR
jgi:deoxyguanosine kinase